MWFSGMLCLVLLAAWLSPTPVSSFGPLQNNYAGLNQRLRLDMSAGVYLHVPFCRRRCFYCDFPIQVVGDRASTQAAQSLAYEQLLLREIAVVNAAFQRQGHFPEVDSIYFGGGTPSLLLDESECNSNAIIDAVLI